MPTTIQKWVRVHAGVTRPLGRSGKNLTVAGNGISQIAEDLQQRSWLPIVDAFRTFAVCPPAEVRAIFQSLMLVVVPWVSA